MFARWAVVSPGAGGCALPPTLHPSDVISITLDN